MQFTSPQKLTFSRLHMLRPGSGEPPAMLLFLFSLVPTSNQKGQCISSLVMSDVLGLKQGKHYNVRDNELGTYCMF